MSYLGDQESSTEWIPKRFAPTTSRFRLYPVLVIIRQARTFQGFLEHGPGGFFHAFLLRNGLCRENMLQTVLRHGVMESFCQTVVYHRVGVPLRIQLGKL